MRKRGEACFGFESTSMGQQVRTSKSGNCGSPLLDQRGSALANFLRVASTKHATVFSELPRVGHTATLLLNGKVLICGGANSYSSLGTVWASAELYDPVSGTFTTTGNMATARKFHTATLLSDGTVLLAGGTASANNDFSTRSAELYDPATGTFTPAPDMVQPRMYHTATLLKNGNVLLAGGLYDSSAEIYDPVTRVFTATGPMGLPGTIPIPPCRPMAVS